MTKKILITGAARGIGRALALETAGRSYDLALTDILPEELENLKKEIVSLHPSARVETEYLDVTDYDSVPAVLKKLDSALGGLDIVYVNAGIFNDCRVGKNRFDCYKKTVEVNLLGAIATIEAAVAIFKERGRGHIAAPSSIAALRGMPGNASYSATKAGISIFLETVRAELYRTNINVTVLFPGYIDTDLNRALKSRPFLVSVEKGAKIIADLIEKKVKRSTVPVFPWNIIARVLRLLPDSIIARM